MSKSPSSRNTHVSSISLKEICFYNETEAKTLCVSIKDTIGKKGLNCKLMCLGGNCNRELCFEIKNDFLKDYELIKTELMKENLLSLKNQSILSINYVVRLKLFWTSH